MSVPRSDKLPELDSSPVGVLVVSDDPVVIEECRYSFPSRIDVSFAGDAREAFRALRSSRPAVVIVDLQTGSAGGFALARDMRADDRLEKLPIVMLLERDQDSWIARQAGAERILTKPVKAATLVAEVLSLI